MIDMIHLRQFIKESIINEDNGQDTPTQELLSCVFFDAFFNKGLNFDKSEEIIDYYVSIYDTLISELSKISKIPVAVFDKIMHVREKKRGGLDDNKTWIKSFRMQCDSLNNWISKHPSFNTNLIFVHHDTKIGIFNGNITTNWSIAKRVENGRSQFHINKKDDYQKADIYMLIKDISAKPEKDIISEITYWCDSIDNKSSDLFAGISLKMLNKQISNPHTYGVGDFEFIVGDDIICNIPIFRNVIFDQQDLNNSQPGITSSFIKFDATYDSDPIGCEFDIRTSGNLATEHIKEPNKRSDSCFSGKSVSTAQMTAKGMGGQAGRMQSIVTEWCKKYDIEVGIDAFKNMNSGSCITQSNSINKTLKDNNIKITSNISLSDDCCKMIDWVFENTNNLIIMFKEFDKSKHRLTDTIIEQAKKIGIILTEDNYINILIKVFSICKWKIATCSSLAYFDAICHRMNEVGVKQTLTELFCVAKGISMGDLKHLPYVMIG